MLGGLCEEKGLREKQDSTRCGAAYLESKTGDESMLIV